MMYYVILTWARIFLRFYFRKIYVHGAELIPKNGPLIIASNHPSSFMEASVLAIVMGRPIHFLVRGDVFNPRFMWLFRWTKQIPIYRQKDGISNLRKNAETLDLSYRKLAEGNAILIFPEAKTEWEKRLRPVQRGAAHLVFGTTPFLAEDQAVTVIPVGVNFTDPRLPGTDVVVQFGKPFTTEKASREDRAAIDRFTENLSAAMQPLIIGVEERNRETYYDVLASIFYRLSKRYSTVQWPFEKLTRIAGMVNQPENNPEVFALIDEHLKTLKKHNISEVVYYPQLLLKSTVGLAILWVSKAIWLILGGWIWRLTRKVIFSKVKAPTYRGPVSLGAAMVVYLLVTLLFFTACLLMGWAAWIPLIWLLVMAAGVYMYPPLSLISKVFSLKHRIKIGLMENVFKLEKAISYLN